MLKLLVMLHVVNGALVDKYVVDVLVDDHEVVAERQEWSLLYPSLFHS